MNDPSSHELLAIMPIEAVLDFYQQTNKTGTKVWIDGGWGVEALLGKKTRDHSDLDVVIDMADSAALLSLLKSNDFTDVAGRGDNKWNFILTNQHGHEIDIHSVEFDVDGNARYGLNGEVRYPAGSLEAVGTIGGLSVRCVSAQQQVKLHTGYPLDEDDFRDVSRLCNKFDIDLPLEYFFFVQK
jgi:lincosamide nucleotidyltransferase A/C/D/E